MHVRTGWQRTTDAHAVAHGTTQRTLLNEDSDLDAILRKVGGDRSWASTFLTGAIEEYFRQKLKKDENFLNDYRFSEYTYRLGAAGAELLAQFGVVGISELSDDVNGTLRRH